jgi:hypothetical protein
MSNEQDNLFGWKDPWQEEWQDMPEYNNSVTKPPAVTATFKFKNEEDFEKFKEIVKEHLFEGGKPFDGMQLKEAKSAWWPPREKASEYTYES